MVRRHISICMMLSLLLIAGAHATVQAQEVRHPLLMPGKHSLYQRAIAKPRATIRAAPDASAAAEPVVPFSVFYVYARNSVAGVDWVEVGPNTSGRPQGWVRARQLLPWNQALTVAFREPLGHDRVLLFRDRASLKELVDSWDLGVYRQLYRQAEQGELSAESPVLAIQPKAYIDVQEDFYLVPIQQHEEIFLGNQKARMLQVATVPLADREVPAPGKTYRSGVVFVTDSTISMGPYIDRTREAVRKVFETIKGSGLQDKVGFGLTAYRDTLHAVPELEYLTRTYATLEQGLNPESFFERVNAVEPASVSSYEFVEDTYAGIKAALDEIDWRGYDARYIVLITDAGARPAHDPLGATGLDEQALRQLAQDKGVAIWVLHLLTPAGEGNHAAAAAQYQRLSYYPGIGNFYYGVEIGRVHEFGRVLEALAGQITQQVRDTAKGVPPIPIPAEKDTGSQLSQLQRKVDKLGYALRMRYLQQVEGAQIPELFDAWLVDHDFVNPDTPTLDVRVLLTRNQLSDLQAVLRRVLDTAEEGVLSPRNFLNDLKSLAATVSRDPAAVGASTRVTGGGGVNLADLGYMREYIEDLPYTGEVMSLSLENWQDWPAKEQLEFIHRLENKLNYYQALHDETDLWIALDGGPVSGDSVFPLALDMLP